MNLKILIPFYIRHTIYVSVRLLFFRQQPEQVTSIWFTTLSTAMRRNAFHVHPPASFCYVTKRSSLAATVCCITQVSRCVACAIILLRRYVTRNTIMHSCYGNYENQSGSLRQLSLAFRRNDEPNSGLDRNEKYRKKRCSNNIIKEKQLVISEI